MKVFSKLLGITGIALLIQGCATEFSATEYSVNVSTDRPGKSFKVYNQDGTYIHQGKTPQIVMLNSQSDFFEKEEYTFEVGGKKRMVKANLSPFYYANIFNIIGFAVDGITGAMWALPNDVNLDKKQSEDKPNL